MCEHWTKIFMLQQLFLGYQKKQQQPSENDVVPCFYYLCRLEKYRAQRMNEMFPDEIDTPTDTAARTRFAR